MRNESNLPYKANFDGWVFILELTWDTLRSKISLLEQKILIITYRV